MRKSRRARPHWIAAEKIRVLFAGMEPGVGASAVCRKEAILKLHKRTLPLQTTDNQLFPRNVPFPDDTN